KLRLALDVVAIALTPIDPRSPRLRPRPAGPPADGVGSGPPIGSARWRTARSGSHRRGAMSSPSPSLLRGPALLRIAPAVIGEALQIGADQRLVIRRERPAIAAVELTRQEEDQGLMTGPLAMADGAEVPDAERLLGVRRGLDPPVQGRGGQRAGIGR